MPRPRRRPFAFVRLAPLLAAALAALAAPMSLAQSPLPPPAGARYGAVVPTLQLPPPGQSLPPPAVLPLPAAPAPAMVPATTLPGIVQPLPPPPPTPLFPFPGFSSPTTSPDPFAPLPPGRRHRPRWPGRARPAGLPTSAWGATTGYGLSRRGSTSTPPTNALPLASRNWRSVSAPADAAAPHGMILAGPSRECSGAALSLWDSLRPPAVIPRAAPHACGTGRETGGN